MTTKVKIRVASTLAVLIILALGVRAWQKAHVPRPDPRARQIYLTLNPYGSAESPEFWIRVTEHPDEKANTFLAGSFYMFDAGPSDSGPWTNIMTVHLDDPDPIPVNNVQFISDKVGYVFLYDKLAVTSDAGLSWSSWELGRANAEWRPKRAYILNVNLLADGSGTMEIEVFASGKTIKLHTRDFGKNWTPE